MESLGEIVAKSCRTVTTEDYLITIPKLYITLKKTCEFPFNLYQNYIQIDRDLRPQNQ